LQRPWATLPAGKAKPQQTFSGRGMKALELQMSDNGWQRAQHLEFIAPEGAELAERDEQRMAAQEQALEAKMMQQVNHPKPQWNNNEGKGKGEGQNEGKGKKGGKCGKWQQPEQENKGTVPAA